MLDFRYIPPKFVHRHMARRILQWSRNKGSHLIIIDILEKAPIKIIKCTRTRTYWRDEDILRWYHFLALHCQFKTKLIWWWNQWYGLLPQHTPMASLSWKPSWQPGHNAATPHSITDRTLTDTNTVRLYLRVAFLSDLMLPNGTSNQELLNVRTRRET